MIHYVTGPLGAGKSYYGCRKMAEALLKGKAVLTNVQLVENWEHIILTHAPHYRLAGKQRRREFRLEMRERYAYVPAIEDIVHALLNGHGQGRGVRVIDEAHNEVNNREWASANQKEMLKIMALSRKRGWDDYIIAQHKDNTDASLRRISAVEIRLIDWQQLTKLPFFQTTLLPFHLFLAQAFPTNTPATVKSGGKTLWREVFLLSWQRKIYNTFQDFGGAYDFEENSQAITLPVPGGFDYAHYLAAKSLDEMMRGYRRAEKTASAEAEAVRDGILRSIGATRERRPLPRPSHESRTPTSHPHSATSGSGE